MGKLFGLRAKNESSDIYGISARLQRVCNSYGFGDVILSKDVSVNDIGCNDGSFLANF